jgi:uncharacterized protein (UPF0332 family)
MIVLDDKRLRAAESRVKQRLAEGIIMTRQEREFTDFFLTNANKSLNSANALYDLSTDKEMQQKTGYPDFDGFLWVVNACYYSMFYAVRALLESEGIRIKSDMSVHSITFDALLYFFYLNGRLQKKFIEDFAEAKEEAAELLGKQKADQLIEDYFWEKEKRASFTYDTKEIIIRAKAKTSLARATSFNQDIKSIIRK